MKKEYTVEQLQETARTLREDVISMLVTAKSGHSAGPLGMADIFAALYFRILSHDPSHPDWEDRDRLVLSNGHICPIRYAAMARSGYFPVAELHTLRKFGSRLQGHPERTKLPGLETTSGPLGSGLSQAAGMALSAKMDEKKWRTYCVMSDGEHDEGQTWEAVLFVAKAKLSHLTVIIDRNKIQIDGNTEDILPLDPLKDKYEAFNWKVVEIDGHDMEAILEAFTIAQASVDKPVCIIANTIPGKGVSFMEGKYEWHGKPPTPEEGEKALAELRASL